MTDARATDDLKDFNQALAVQATSGQVNAYDSMVKSSENATQSVEAFIARLQKQPNSGELSAAGHSVSQSLEKACAETKQFIDAFSKTQQSGLKEIAQKVTKADSEVAQLASRLVQETMDVNLGIPEVSNSAKSLHQALMNLHGQQVDLGQEMGISQDSSFDLAPASASIIVEKQPISITVSGTITRVASKDGQSVFDLQLTTNLSDLQQSITEILRSRLDKQPRCGEWQSVRQATFTASRPASVVFVQLHLEHWGCFGAAGQEISNELAEGNGALTLRLTPGLGQNSTLQLAAEVTHIDADGWAGNLLRSDGVGTKVRDEIAQSVLAALRTATNFKDTVPELAQDSTTINGAEFYEAGGLHMVLSGIIQISDEQLKTLGDQSKEHLSAQGPPQ